MTTRRFDVLAVGPPMHDAAALRQALEPSLRALASLGGREAAEAALGAADPLVVLVGTGGTEAEILRLHGARQAAAPEDPLLLVTHPAHNSLPAALEALARVRQDGARGRIVHLPGPDDAPALARLQVAIDDLRAFRRLHRSRIGLVGAPSDWLVASVPAAEAVRRTWGPETVAVDLDGVLDAAGAAAGERAVALAGSLPPGPVTLVRLGGRALEQAFVAEGHAVPAAPREDLCRTQVDVTLAPGEVAELLARPLGNHVVLVPGRSAARLRDYRDWAVAT